MISRVLIVIAAIGLPAAAAAAPPLEAYGKLPSLEQVTLSPSGKHVAFVAVMGEKRTFTAATTEGKPLVRAPVGDVKLRALTWAGDDRVLATYSQTETLPPEFNVRKTEMAGVLSIDLVKKTAKPIFANDSSLISMIFGSYGVRRVDGRWYGYFGAIEKKEFGYRYADLHRVDLEKTTAFRVAHGSESAEDWILGADGKIVARSRYDDRSGEWRLLEGSSGGREITRRKTLLNQISVNGLGRTADTLLLVDATGDRDVVLEQPLAAGAQARPLFEDEIVEQFLIDQDSQLLLGALVDGGRKAILFDPARQKKVNAAMKAFAGFNAELIDYTSDFERMIVFTDGKDDSGTYWLVDIATRGARIVGHARREIEAKDVGPTRLFRYKAGDGLEMDGVLTLPPGREAKGLPVVVMPHGGPIGVSDEAGFDWWAQAFASRGYAVFQPNFRGSGGRGQAFREAGMGEWGRKMQTDVSDGLAALAKEGIVDPKRACIVGGSYGGYAALAGVTLQKGLYRCAVSYGGVTDLAGMLSDFSRRAGRVSDTTRYWRAAIGSRADMKAYSPTEKAASADAPVLLIHGRDDVVVPVEQSRKMDRELRQAGKPVEYVELKGEDHWLSREETRLAMLKASVGFVEKHNPAD